MISHCKDLRSDNNDQNSGNNRAEEFVVGQN